MQYDLREFFSTVKDFRRVQGRRHGLENILTIVIMAILSGHQGLRGFARFAAGNEIELTELLGLKHGVPCFYTFQTVFKSLKADTLTHGFNEWMRTYHADSNDVFIALDGKVVKSSVNGGNTALQNFVSVVSAFGHQSGTVYGMQFFVSGKSYELKTLKELVSVLGLRDKVFTADALHTEKKRLI